MKLHTAASRLLVICGLAALTACGGSGDDSPTRNAGPPVVLRLATTTSVNDSGLLAKLLPAFERDSGIRVTVTAVGTGAAFKIGRDGNADLLLVHDRKGEDDFVATGDGSDRIDFLWNTFEVLGPADDPAGVRGSPTGAEAMKRIAAARARFVSRGDDSGTHRRERALLAAVGIAAPPGGPALWDGFAETGQGMGQSLNVANQLDAYLLCDQGTRLSFKTPLTIAPLVADTDDLKNRYAIVRISKLKHPNSDVANADRLVTWLKSPTATAIIEDLKVGGETLFHPMSSGQ